MLSIIIVNYNTKEEVKRCLTSIYENPPGGHFEIFVVDNNSSDGSADAVEENFKQVNLIQNDKNVGFASANNKVLKDLSTKYVLLLNPDTVILPGAIDKMIDFMEKNPKAGACGSRLVNENAKLQPSCEMFPSMKGELLKTFYLDQLFGKTRYMQKYTLIGWDHNKSRSADWITGACFMLRKEAFDDIGLMDENYFLYYEDVEWCYKLKQKGWEVHFLADVEVIHSQGRSTKPILAKSILISYLSRYYFFKKNYGINSAKMFKNIINLGLFLRIISLSILSVLDYKRRKSHLQRVIGYYNSMSINLEKKIAMDVSSFSKIKAGVEFYTKNISQAIGRSLNSGSSFIMIDKKPPASHNNIFNKVYRAINLVYHYQIRLPLQALFGRLSVLHLPAYIIPVVKFCPSVVTIHDLSFILFPEKFIKTYRVYLQFFVPLSMRRADYIIADSRSTKEDIKKLFKIKDDKIKVVYPGVSDSFRVIDDKSVIEEVKQKYKLPERFILFVGTLEPRKNVLGLIKAFNTFKKTDDKNYKLVITGSPGWLYNDIYTTVDELKIKDDVVFTGYLADEDIPKLYNAADLLVYPSFYEGFGFPIVEAMKCGTPTIASNISSLPEVVGDAGILIDPNNTDEIAEAISNVLNDDELKKKLVKNGIERAKLFTWERSADNVIDIYNKCLENKKFVK
ncbi:MAG: glycosyltransferase [Armatimonadota bacterium]